MRSDMQELVKSWDGLAVVVRFDRPSGAWIFVALHDDTLGTPAGGCRMNVYATPADGLRDALRLAEGMTYKWASIGFPFGGGKSVLAVPRPMRGEERWGLLRRFAALLRALRGAYGTGEDLGTTPEDMLFLSRECDHVVGVDPERGIVDPGPYTARGVLSGMQAALAHATGNPDLAGRTVLVQGVGDVGEPLARSVAAEGGSLMLADVRRDLVTRLARELGARVVEPEAVYDVECTVYAPCALGGTLDRNTISRLRCRVVAGSANNQLEGPADADRLRERGILYAPDYVTNAGGAMAFGLISQGVADPAELEARVAGIGDSLAAIFREADETGLTPLAAARRRVQRVLERARAGAAVAPAEA